MSNSTYQKILPEDLLFAILEQFSNTQITEIRVRIGQAVVVGTILGYQKLMHFDEPFVADKRLMEQILALATENSLYAVTEQLVSGYLNCAGGVRVGISGEGVREGAVVTAIKNITSLCIRVPSQVFGCVDSCPLLYENPKSTLILSPPLGGKTTFLRELVRKTSNYGAQMLVLDERGELGSSRDGVPMLELGANTDIYTLIPKRMAYENALRSMSPEIVVTDEVFGREEIEAIGDISRAGVKVFATVHAKSLENLKENADYSRLLPHFERIVTLSRHPKPGTVLQITTC